MFDENSEAWIRIYKSITVVLFWIFNISGLVAGIVVGGSNFIVCIMLLLAGVFLACIQLVVNMLVIQFLNNVQIIRKKIEQNNNNETVLNDDLPPL